jgi:hypothetical protein
MINKLLFLFLVLTNVCQAQFKMLSGCSGKSLEGYGIRRDVYGTWMGRSSWKDFQEGNWMWAEESGLPQWKKEHFDRAVDIGTLLIPTDMQVSYNTLS